MRRWLLLGQLHRAAAVTSLFDALPPPARPWDDAKAQAQWLAGNFDRSAAVPWITAANIAQRHGFTLTAEAFRVEADRAAAGWPQRQGSPEEQLDITRFAA